jgi:hypothetical protein
MSIRLIKIEKSIKPQKKLQAVFSINGKNKTVHFGASHYEDFTKHKDTERKRLYILRHQKEDWTDPTKAGTLSRFILWNKKDIKSSIKDYSKRFSV